MNKPTKKLTLKKDVLRKLNEADLASVAGGHANTSTRCDICSSVTMTCPSSDPATQRSCCNTELQ